MNDHDVMIDDERLVYLLSYKIMSRSFVGLR